jgi:phage protein D
LENLTNIATDMLDQFNFAAVNKLHLVPIYQLSYAGEDLTQKLKDRLISLTLTDNRGFETDQLDIELDDSDGLLALPKRNRQISLALGWKASGLVDKGLFTVDEIEHIGSPDRVLIRARSADMTDGLVTQRERSFHKKTVGDIVRSIATQHKLIPVINPELDKQRIDHLDQANESDANLLSRLAQLFDAIATVKQNRLLFMPIGEARTVNGKILSTTTLTRASGDSHRFSVAGRDSYLGVKAYYQDKQKAKRGEVIVGEKINKTTEEKIPGRSPKKTKKRIKKRPTVKKREAETTSVPPNELSADDLNHDNLKVLRHTYANKKNAQRAAQAEWQRLQRGVASFSMTLAHGQPELFTEMPVTLRGWKPEIDHAAWIITRVVHTLSSDSYTTTLALEVAAKDMTDFK